MGKPRRRPLPNDRTAKSTHYAKTPGPWPQVQLPNSAQYCDFSDRIDILYVDTVSELSDSPFIECAGKPPL